MVSKMHSPAACHAFIKIYEFNYRVIKILIGMKKQTPPGLKNELKQN
jgi:hypothetical protein